MKATANSGSNIAFIKYWGVRENGTGGYWALNPSVSMTLQTARTTTTVEFDPRLTTDTCTVNDRPADPVTMARVQRVLQRVREQASIRECARVVSVNSMPASVGLASSASGFSALARASARAAGLPEETANLVPLAILGSGSACRSIYGGYVLWIPPDDGNIRATVEQLATEREWKLVDLATIVSRSEKQVSSAEGHLRARTSSLLEERLSGLTGRLRRVREAIRNHELSSLGEAMEEDCLTMHTVAMTSKPPIFYWDPATIEVMRKVQGLRARAGLQCYFTIDAGPNVHVITTEEESDQVRRELEALPGVLEVLRLDTGPGAYLTDQHLF